MRSLLVCLSLLSGSLLLAAPAFGQDNLAPKKKDKTRSRDATAQDYAALGQMKEVTGRLLGIEGSQQLTLKVDYPTLEPKNKSSQSNPNNGVQRLLQAQLRQQQQADRKYQQILRVRNPVQRQQRLDQFFAQQQAQQFASAQKLTNAVLNPRNSSYKTVTASVTFQLPVAANVKVAKANLEIDYDDKGQVLQYTKEDLKKKQDKNMPGYAAKFDDLQPGQMIKVYLHKTKATAAKAKDQKPEDGIKAVLDKADSNDEVKDKAVVKDKAKEPAPAQAAPPEARMILILTEADPNSLPRQSTGKKKKQ